MCIIVTWGLNYRHSSLLHILSIYRYIATMKAQQRRTMPSLIEIRRNTQRLEGETAHNGFIIA